MPRSPQNYNEVLDWLLDADRTFPAREWRIGDIDLWPLARAMIARALQEDVVRGDQEAPQEPDLGPRAARLREAQAAMRRNRGGVWLGELRLEPENGGAEPDSKAEQDIALINANRPPAVIFENDRASGRWLLVGNANLSQVIGGRETHRYFDPVAAEAAGRGIESAVMISSPLSPHDRLSRVRHHGVADSLYELRRQARKLMEPVELPELDRLQGLTPSPSVGRLLQRPFLEATARNLARYVSAFAELIDMWRIGAIITIPYASQLGTALCAAGRRRGIPVIDIQHGLIGPPNPHYKLATAEGFNTLPSHIWLWSDANIDRPQMGRMTASFVGGNPSYALVATERRAYPEWQLAKQPGGKDVLVTLSNGLLPAWLPLLIEGAPRSWRWWVRPHPAAFDRAAEGAAQIERVEAMANVELRRAVELPLPILMELADIHLTQSSSTAIEARAAGVRTLFYDRVGYRYFESLPGAAGDRFCEPGQLEAAIDEMLRKEPGKRRETLELHAERLRDAVREVSSWVTDAGTPQGSV